MNSASSSLKSSDAAFQTTEPRADVYHHLQGLRVLAFCDYLSDESCGGIEAVALEIYRRLAAWGCELEIVTSVPKYMKPPESKPRMVIHPVRMVEMSKWLRGQSGIALGLSGTSRKVARHFRPHIIYAHGLHFQSTVAAARLQAATGLPLVTVSHVAGLEHLPQPLRFLTKGYEATLGRYILSRSTRVVSISPSVTSHLQRIGARTDRIDVVPNGVDIDRFKPSTRSTQSVTRLMFIGRHIGNKGPQIFLEALVELSRQSVPFRADFLSNGPLRSQLERRASEAGLTESVRFLGRVPDVAEELRHADIVVRPSLTEGLPLSLLEAMASGVCVVASDIGGNRDLIRNGVNGVLVPPANPRALASALRELIENPARRLSLATAGLETARQYSWEVCADQTAQILVRASGSLVEAE
jgi:glycosyltransferase involved in cell wall biosynthesis